MSNIYIQEPPTNGKVLLHTSVGDIDVELWSKEAPKACRNFIQLCLEGYYNGTLFHRVVKDFIAQGGDPTGTGSGGESIYGKPFKDEFHSRLRFNRRGLIAMANAGPNDNGSQFFFTLAATPELDKKHTLFGKVTGHTVYNMLKLADIVTNEEERPLDPPKIHKVQILHNPYEDMIPRIQNKKEEQTEKKKKKKGTKNFKLLSFGEEAEEDEEEVNKATKDLRTKGKSSHDVLKDKALSSVPAISPTEETRKRTHSKDDEDEDSDGSSDVKSKEMKVEKEASNEEIPKPSDSPDSQPRSDPQELSKLEELRKEAKRLKRELRGLPADSPEEETTTAKDKPPESDVVAEFKEEQKKYFDIKKKNQDKSKRESMTLSILAKFKTKLSSARSLADYDDDKEEEKEEEEEKEDEDEDPNDVSWMNHKLSFEADKNKVLDANVHDVDRYELFDPRNPLNKRKLEASKIAMKKKK